MRHGTSNLYAALEFNAGTLIGHHRQTPCRRLQPFFPSKSLIALMLRYDSASSFFR